MEYSFNRLTKAQAVALLAMAQEEKRACEIKVNNLDYSQDKTDTRTQKIASNRAVKEAELLGLNAAIANTTDTTALEKLNLEKRKTQNQLDGLEIRNEEMGASSLVRREFELAVAEVELAETIRYTDGLAAYIATLS